MTIEPDRTYGPGTPCSQCGDLIEDHAPNGAEYCEDHRDDPRPNNGNHEGVCCLECYSVIFNVGKLLRHIENRDHYWYKSGEGLVVNAKTLTENGFEFDP